MIGFFFVLIAIFLRSETASEFQLAEVAVAIKHEDAKQFRETTRHFHKVHDQQRLLNLILAPFVTASEPLQNELIVALNWFEPELKVRAIPALIAIVKKEKSKNRGLALKCLGTLESRAKLAADTVLGCLRTENRLLRSEACLTFWQITQQVEPIAHILDDLLKEQNKPISHTLNDPLEELNSGADQLTEGIRLRALQVAAQIGSPLRKTKVRATLMNLMFDENVRIRIAVYPMIPEFAETKQEATARLVAALVTEANRLEAFHKLVEEGRIPLEQVVGNWRQVNESAAVYRALVLIGEPAVPELTKLLRLRDNHRAQLSALSALSALGKTAIKATDEVRQLTNDPNATIKNAANKTLVAIAEE